MNAAPDRASKRGMSFVSLREMAAVLAVSSAIALPALALERGSRAPEISLADLRGRNVSIAGLRGKVVVVDFWASWCVPCRDSMPALDRIYRRHKNQGLVVVGVSVDEERSSVNDFLRRVSVSFPIVHDRAHEVAERYQPTRMPSTYIIDRRGLVRFVESGFRSGSEREMERKITELLRDR